jgi:hypothetical protein
MSSYDLTDKTLFVSAHQIADMIYSYATTNLGDFLTKKPTLCEYRHNNISLLATHRGQTDSGLFLEIYDGTPQVLWTPWGEWIFSGHLWSSEDWRTLPIFQELMNRLGAIPYRSKQQEVSQDSRSCLYALYQIDEVSLSDPIERDPEMYVDPSIGYKAWTALKEQVKQ